MSEVKIKSRSKSSRTTGAFYRSKYFAKRLAVLQDRDFRLFYDGYTTSQFGTANSSAPELVVFLNQSGICRVMVSANASW